MASASSTPTDFASIADEQAIAEPESMRSLAWRKFRRHPAALFGTIILLLVLGTTLLAPVIAPYDPEGLDTANRFRAPSVQHWMGTDRTGRDVLSRLLFGGRISLTVGFLSVVTAVLVGTTLGALSGYLGGLIDQLLMRVTDLFLCFPPLFLLILFSFLLIQTKVTILQGGVGGIVLVIGAMSWMAVARLVRACFLSVKEMEFVTAARAAGAGDFRIASLHILPNAISPIVVNATMGVAWAILTESGLSFLGYGVQPPVASWGNMLSDAQTYMHVAPWLTLFPGFMIFITVISINFIGDALRDALDPYKLER